ncbi:MAG: DNA polymerase I [Chloroflexota bacterium]|jgi:DNA polymerase-1|nr:DNA polymerase I [Chloroflexota bacterium]
MPPVLYLLDGHGLAYRAYYALTAGGTRTNAFQTSSGEPTAGVYGFTSILLRIFEQENPDYLAVVFDKGKTFRHEMYDDYKGTRAKMPDDLRPQVERMREIVDAFNIPRLERENYEADDVIGSVARWASEEKGLGVKIITGDKDLLQLVTDRVVVNLAGSRLSDAKDYFPGDVKKKLGVLPDKVVDFKALCGDSSDNIPGVKGVGKVTATKLLEKFGSLDGIFEHIDEISGRAKSALEGSKEVAYLSQKLSRIVTDLDVELDLEQARIDRFNPHAVEDLFRKLEFRSLTEQLNDLVGKMKPIMPQGEQLDLFEDQAGVSLKGITSGEIDMKIVDNPEALADLVKILNDAELIALDTETTDTDVMRAKLVGISLAVQPNLGYYIPVGHRKGNQLDLEKVFSALSEPLTNPDIGKAGHNLKYDYLVLKRAGLTITPLTFDTMIAEWLINPASRNLGLKNLAWVRLGYEMTHIEDLIGKGRGQKTMDLVPIPEAAGYAAADAAICLRLIPQLQDELRGHQAVDLFKSMEMPLIPILAAMEEAGIKLDEKFFDRFSEELEKKLGEIESRIHEAVGNEFNLNSTQQLSEALFETLGLEPPDRARKTASGYYSTAASVLEAMTGQHPVIEWVLEYRELEKLRSTYVDALPEQVNPQTGRVHTSFNQTGTVTGRIASSDPNLQNIPTRTEIGRRVRNGFVAREGWRLLAVDYSQIELRIVAHMSQDEAMLAAFRAGQDIHATTAAAVHGIDLDEVTPEMRRHAKAINFGLIYGMSAYGLTNATDLTLAEAENFIETYFEKFPGVKKYLDGIRETAAEQGYVETLLGRRRYFPNLARGASYNVRQREEREAINAPIQGTAADIIKIAMLKLPDELNQAGLQAQMLLQVHDELMFEVPKDELDETTSLVQRVMENAYKLDIPLSTEAKAGPSWGGMEKL